MFTCPVTLGLPGVSHRSFQKSFVKRLRHTGIIGHASDEAIENQTLGFVVAHRALSRTGIGLLGREIDDKAFVFLNDLETSWSRRTPKPRFVWKTLKSVGDILLNCFTEVEIAAILHASSLTCFSEFPIGLAIFPGGTAPLCCRVPIAYRPIVPLTRTLQMELAPMPTIYLRGRLKILVAECIPKRDLVGRLSRVGWDLGRDVLLAQPNIECNVAEIHRIEDLRGILAEHAYDVLVISAHGGMDSERNTAGFVCGDKLIVAEDLGVLPQIVCLSACQISPRGQGTVNVCDLMFRQGAAVVIGAMVPIDVRRNSILMARFFVNMAEALAGRSPLKTLEEVWHFTVTSNAVNDILSGNNGLSKWAVKGSSNSNVIVDFMLKRSGGRLRKSHVYLDSETVLAEIAHNHGIVKKFRSWMSNGYIPESVFYVVMGWPERVVFYDPEFEAIYKEYEPNVLVPESNR